MRFKSVLGIGLMSGVLLSVSPAAMADDPPQGPLPAPTSCSGSNERFWACVDKYVSQCESGGGVVDSEGTGTGTRLTCTRP